MKFPMIHFVDPTIPGVSVQDLQVHLVHGGGFSDTASDRRLRRDLSHLGGDRLRDLGYDLSEG